MDMAMHDPIGLNALAAAATAVAMEPEMLSNKYSHMPQPSEAYYQASPDMGPVLRVTTENRVDIPDITSMIGASNALSSGDKLPQRSESPELPEPLEITYMVNIGGKFKRCRMPSTEKYKKWRAAIIQASGFSETLTFKHELSWKMYTAPKNQDPVAVDNKDDYKMMVGEVEKARAKKEPTVAIIINNLPPKDNTESSRGNKPIRKSKKARVEQPDSPVSTSESNSDSESKQRKIPAGMPSTHELEELIKQRNPFCESHMEHCHVSTARGTDGYHVILTKLNIKQWAQSILQSLGTSTLEEPPVYFLKDRMKPKLQVPPPGKPNKRGVKSTSQSPTSVDPPPNPGSGSAGMVVMANPIQGNIPVNWPAMYSTFPPMYPPPSYYFQGPAPFPPMNGYPAPSRYSPSAHGQLSYHQRQGGTSRMLVSSSDDFTPPSSAFPTIGDWLQGLEEDAGFNPDQLQFTQYAAQLNQLGYYRLDVLAAACQEKGLHELGVDILPGLSAKLCRAMRSEFKKVSRKFMRSKGY
ncbi:uncharacterized protein EI90DRAFT_3015637 [Cantharellus anzutake]|nr:uncharacterized protein EI90DRAFT_3015637 [Cantharellus anzutake]KAF8333226.1 hypothetical protein EI90DRAFT_3015637 [Cantharellus anzutake]